ncbi:MAG TPA: GPW/gp25 family protein [Blastocatellia bacterium]|nr:GPW/gp25 family protein [Blastocatellia bacterium]
MNERLMGFAFPFRINGGVKRARDFEKIEQNVRHLLSTRLGERAMLRTYGGGLHHRLQSPNDATLRALVKHEIEQALRLFMPEVQLTAPLQVTAKEEELFVVIEYKASPRDLVRRLQLTL